MLQLKGDNWSPESTKVFANWKGYRPAIGEAAEPSRDGLCERIRVAALLEIAKRTLSSKGPVAPSTFVLIWGPATHNRGA